MFQHQTATEATDASTARAAGMLTPAPGYTITQSPAVFSISGIEPEGWKLEASVNQRGTLFSVGKFFDSNTYVDSSQNITVLNVPENAVNITLKLSVGSEFNYTESYVSYSASISDTPVEPTVPMVTSPANGATLTGRFQEVTIANPNGDLVGFWVGSEVDANNYFNSGSLRNTTSIIATGLPTNGSTIHLRLAYDDGSGVQFIYYTFTAFTSVALPSSIPFPAESGTPSPVSINSINGSNESASFSYNGASLSVENVLTGDRLPYTKQSGITAAGYPGSNGYLVKDRPGNFIDQDGNSQGASGFSSASRTSLTRPGIVYGFVFNQQTLRERNMATGQFKDLANLSSQLSGQVLIGSGEGNFSLDENLVVANNSSTYVMVNISAGTKLVRSASQIINGDSQTAYGSSGNKIDWVGVSMGGTKIVARVDGFGGNTDRRWIVYDLDWSNPQGIGSDTSRGDILRGSHACFAIGSNGEDLLAQYHWDSFIFTDLAELDKVYRIPARFIPDHVSGVASAQNPGWVMYATIPTGNSESIAGLVNFNKADFAGAVKSQIDQDYLGETYYATSTPDKRIVGHFPGCLDTSGGSYPITCLPQITPDGNTVFVSGGVDGGRYIAKVTVDGIA